jgi:hypothetical protein
VRKFASVLLQQSSEAALLAVILGWFIKRWTNVPGAGGAHVEHVLCRLSSTLYMGACGH